MRLTAMRLGAALAFVIAMGAAGHAQTERTLYDFTGRPDGAAPQAPPIAHGGVLYGTTRAGGTGDDGTIYAIDAKSGAYTQLHQFTSGDDGVYPYGELVFADGALYGTTSIGGQFQSGIIFRLDPATGTETVVYSFGSAGPTDAARPQAGLTPANRVLYGTTTVGGARSRGAVFSFDPVSGIERVLYSFTGGSDGSEPEAPVTYAGGHLYGTTFYGGANNDGVIFDLDLQSGTETVPFSFDGTASGRYPSAGLLLDAGALYGTASQGGSTDCQGHGCGTLVRLDLASGITTVLHIFDALVDGAYPTGPLALSGGTIYGTTERGYRQGNGLLFSINPDGSDYAALLQFNFVREGSSPTGLVAAGRFLLGTTIVGGSSASQGGTVYAVAP